MFCRRAIHSWISQESSAVYILSLENQLIHKSPSDTILHLAFEDWLFRHSPSHQRTLVLYINRTPSAVLGRHQNAWTEVTHSSDICRVRRFSGGGCVYHDAGNVNYCYMTPRHAFDRNVAVQFISQALKEFYKNQAFAVSPRFDLIWQLKDSSLKIGGSAYRLISNRAYHHGTLLVSSDLKSLSKQLPVHSGMNMNLVGWSGGKATASVPSPVTRLSDHIPGITVDQVVQILAETFSYQNDANIIHISRNQLLEMTEQNGKLQELVDQLQSWQWTFGMSPACSVTLNLNPIVTLTIEQGHVRKVECEDKCMEQRLTEAWLNLPLRSSDLCASLNENEKMIFSDIVESL